MKMNDSVVDPSSFQPLTEAADEECAFFETYQPPEPSYEKANSLSFYTLCTRLEVVWEQSRKDTNRKSKETLLDFLLPRKLFHYLEGGSPYPLLRLLMPDCDNERPHSGLKEKSLANLYARVFGFAKSSAKYMKLVNYNNPIASKNNTNPFADLSIVVQEFVSKTSHRKEPLPSKVTIGFINRYLDELGKIRCQSAANSRQGKKKGVTTLELRRETWLKKLFIDYKLSPLEHKWLVRMIIQKLDIGIGSDSIISYFHPWASMMYDVNKDLRKLCATLSDPNYIIKKKAKNEMEASFIEQQNRFRYLPTSTEPISIGNIISPALSRRTQFCSFLSDIQERHRKYINTLAADSPLRSSLSLKFPAFICETKMDGERMIAHVQAGRVSLHTRNGVSYTKLYAPTLAPLIKKSLAKYKVDVILDGEIVSWDNIRQEIIPFGFNRAVAKCRQTWCQKYGSLDDIDTTVGEGTDASNVMNSVYVEPCEPDQAGSSEETGANCWLKYVIFDILFIGGQDASKLISDACSKCFKGKDFRGGSIIDFPLYQRRTILHHVLMSVENKIELIDCLVIRSDGSKMDGKTYFSSTAPEEYGYPPLVLDSINDTIEGSLMMTIERQKVDIDRRRRRSDIEIHDERARHVQQYFHHIVDKQRNEGAVFKDLATPYGPGSSFRKEGYWFKLKLDYEKLGEAADLDFVVLGAYFATGMRNVGVLSSFLLGCIDDGDQTNKYMTVTSVNGGGISRENLEKLLDFTGFRKGENGQVNLGKWFQSQKKEMPHFISKRSFQRCLSGDHQGWDCKSRLFPDLWIDPEDSFVLTVNAGEIVCSEDYSAGVSLRFPRISRIRAQGFEDEKSISEIETVSDLHDLYKESQRSRHTLGETVVGADVDNTEKRKFCPVYQYESSSRNRKRHKLDDETFPSKKGLDRSCIETNFFSSASFSVLEGTYYLDVDSIDAEEAKHEGWFETASKINSRQDVVDFIVRNGGAVTIGGITSSESELIIGGRVDDARISNFLRATTSTTMKPSSGSVSRHLSLRSGILKWTVLFREKHKAFQMHESEFDLFMKPRKCDFLAMNEVDSMGLDSESHFDLSIYEFKRLLILQPSMSKHIIPWQKRANEELNDEIKLIMLGTYEKLWRNPRFGSRGPAVIYPDIFNSFQTDGVESDDKDLLVCTSLNLLCADFMHSNNFEDILSSIALVKAMGGIVTRLLDDNVTHILCDLMPHHKSIEWTCATSASIYRDPQRGVKLNQQLSAMFIKEAPLLITAEWVFEMWKSNH